MREGIYNDRIMCLTPPTATKETKPQELKHPWSTWTEMAIDAAKRNIASIADGMDNYKRERKEY